MLVDRFKLHLLQHLIGYSQTGSRWLKWSEWFTGNIQTTYITGWWWSHPE